MNLSYQSRIRNNSTPVPPAIAVEWKKNLAPKARLAILTLLSIIVFLGRLSADQTYFDHESGPVFSRPKALSRSSCKDQRDFQRLVQKSGDLNVQGILSNGKKKEKLFSSAMECADSLITRFPDSAMPFFLKSLSVGNLATIRSGKEKIELSRETVRCAEKAIQLDPAFAQPHIILGIYYREVSQASRIQKSIGQRLYGEFPDGTLKDSERALLKALELAPHDLFAHFEIGKTYLAMKRSDKAREHFDLVANVPAASDLTKAIRTSALDALKKHPS